MADSKFAANSRYAGLGTTELQNPDGTKIVYLQRRFVPDPARFVALSEYQVVEGDRIDRMAAAVLGDAEQFYRLADANGCLHPLELEELGRRLRLTLPEGIPGLPHA